MLTTIPSEWSRGLPHHELLGKRSLCAHSWSLPLGEQGPVLDACHGPFPWRYQDPYDAAAPHVGIL